MSTGNVYQFLDRLTNESGFRAEFQAAGPVTTDTIMDFALAKGLVFTEADLKSGLADYPENPIIDRIRERLRVTKVARPAHTK